jgi:hypothetical protein
MVDHGDATRGLRCFVVGAAVRDEMDVIEGSLRRAPHYFPNSGLERNGLAYNVSRTDALLRDAVENCGIPSDSDILEEWRQFRESSTSFDVLTKSLLDKWYAFRNTLRSASETRDTAPKAMPGRYPFIDAEVLWEDADAEGRVRILREIGFIDVEMGGVVGRPFGALDKDTQDALEGYALRRRQRGEGVTLR